MKIRQEQLETLGKNHEDAFVARVIAHLKEDLPKYLERHHLRESKLESLVRDGMEKARGYDVVYEDDIQLFIDCMVILNPRFDSDHHYPWAGETLRRDDLDSGEKMDEIGEHLIFSLEEPPIDDPDEGEQPAEETSSAEEMP